MVCDDLAQECYALSTAIVASGLIIYGMTVVCIAFGRRLAEFVK